MFHRLGLSKRVFDTDLRSHKPQAMKGRLAEPGGVSKA
jgi:hypothetical protein